MIHLSSQMGEFVACHAYQVVHMSAHLILLLRVPQINSRAQMRPILLILYQDRLKHVIPRKYFAKTMYVWICIGYCYLIYTIYQDLSFFNASLSDTTVHSVLDPCHFVTGIRFTIVCIISKIVLLYTHLKNTCTCVQISNKHYTF